MDEVGWICLVIGVLVKEQRSKAACADGVCNANLQVGGQSYARVLARLSGSSASRCFPASWRRCEVLAMPRATGATRSNSKSRVPSRVRSASEQCAVPRCHGSGGAMVNFKWAQSVTEARNLLFLRAFVSTIDCAAHRLSCLVFC